jgi:hypothetical protein
MDNGFTTSKVTTIQDIIAAFQTGTDAVPDDDDLVLDRVDYQRIQYLRQTSGHGGYSNLKLYSLTDVATTTTADINTIRIDVWPTVSSKLVGIHYTPQFTPLAATETPNVNDIESRDIALLAALKIVPLVGRSELAPSIAADISERTRQALDRKIKTMMSGDQDK